MKREFWHVAVALVASAMLTSGGYGQAFAPQATGLAEPLFWKFAPGQTLRYQLVLDGDSRRVMGELTYPFDKMRLELRARWYIEDVEADGTAVITETIERLDCQEDLPTVPESRNPLKVLEGLKFSFRLSKFGLLSDVRAHSRLQKALDTRLPHELSARFGNGLRQFVPRFSIPDDGNCRTVPWQWPGRISVPGLTTPMQAVTQCTYRGIAQNGGRGVDEFAMATTVELINDPSVPVKMSLQGYRGDGIAQFDPAAGRLVMLQESFRGDVNYVVGLGGTRLRVRSKTSWRLLTDAEAAGTKTADKTTD